MKLLTTRPLPEIRAVLFDMDGLVIDSEGLGQIALLDACRRLHYDAVDEAFGLSLLGRTREACLRMLADRVPDFDEEAYSSLCGRLTRELFRKELRAKPGVSQLLDVLNARRIPYALASSSYRERVEFSLSCAGLSGRFPVMVTGDCAVRSKPAPDIFLAAAKMLFTPPENCLVLEDSENGVRAGRAAGSVVCMVPDLLPYSERLAPYVDYVAENLEEVARRMENRSGQGGESRPDL